MNDEHLRIFWVGLIAGGFICALFSIIILSLLQRG